MDIEESFANAISAQEALAASNDRVASLCAGYLFDLLAASNLGCDLPGASGLEPGRYSRTVDGHHVRMCVIPADTERPSRTFEPETIKRMIAIGSLMIESVKLAFGIVSRRCPNLAELRLVVVKNTGDIFIEGFPEHVLALL